MAGINLNNKLGGWFRGSRWGVKPLDKNTREYFAVQFPMFDVDLKYRLVDLEPEVSQPYDPMAEMPKPYTKFVRLAEYKRFSWNAQQLIKEILKFFREFGPLWYPGGRATDDRLLGERHPLTAERVLFEARDMARAVEVYRLLQNGDKDYWENAKTSSLLKDYMVTLKQEGRGYLITSHLGTSREGLRVPVDVYDSEAGNFIMPPLGTNREIVAAAIAYVLESVSDGLSRYPVYLALANRGARGRKLNDDSQVGAWVSAYKYDDLINALWLQFYLDIINQTRLRECANERCLTLFAPIRSDQEYCSHHCRAAQKMRRRYIPKKEAQRR